MENLEKNDEITTTFWDIEESDYLHYTSKEKCIEEIINLMENPVPRKLKIFKYEKINPRFIIGVKTHELHANLRLWLGKVYGEASIDDMLYSRSVEDIRSFLTKLLEEQVRHGCKAVDSFTVDTEEWVKKNHPGWITEGVIKFKEDEDGKEEDTNQTTH